MSTETTRKRQKSRAKLESAVAQAQTPDAQAAAHFELALFHDNHSREAEAVPHYEAALAAGLDSEERAQCLAWLASSLFKTARPEEALERLRQSRDATDDRELMGFLRSLERRVRARIAGA